MLPFEKPSDKISWNQIEIQNEAIQEIISKPPLWLVRWGMSVLSVIVSAILYISWLIRYPEIVQVEFRLTSQNSPKSIASQIDSRLTRILVQDKQEVYQGQILAYLESIASHEEVLALDKYLDSIRQIIQLHQVEELKDLEVPSYLQLGELQQSYQTFVQSLVQFTAFLSDGLYQKQKTLLFQDIKDLKLLLENIENQHFIQQKDYQLALDEFVMQKKLSEQKVISDVEYRREQAKLLAKEVPLKSSEGLMIQNKASQTAKQKEILELENKIREQRNIFIQVLNTLQSEVKSWERKYTLVAPLKGKVLYSGFLQERQVVSQGDILFFITQDSPVTYYGEAALGQHNLGKVKKGQKVLLKFESYPFQEYGSVLGRIEFISEITGQDSLFFAKISLPNGLHTNYQKRISFTSNLKAKAEIITRERRLIETFLQNLNQLWTN